MACLLLQHLAELESFGAPYAAPLASGRRGALSRLLLRRPWKKRRTP